MIQMYRLQDLQLSDVELKQQYYTEFFNGNITSAQNIVNNNPQLASKVINASNLNGLVNNILELENDFDDDVSTELSNDLLDFNLSIDEFIYMTTFNITLQYEANNVVSYNDNLYYCKEKPPICTLPTDTDFWVYLGLKGEKGDYALGVNYVGAWASTTQYNINDMVIYKNVVYIAKTSNLNAVPSSSTSDWFNACRVNPQGIYVSNEEPSNVQEGSIWIELLLTN